MPTAGSAAPAPIRRRRRTVTIFAVAALVAGPPLEFLRYHHYPLLHLEVLLPVAIWLIAAVGLGSWLNRASRPARIVAFTLLLILFADWQFTDHAELPFKLLAVAILAAVWLLEGQIETIVAVVLAAFYLACLPTSSPMRASTRQFPAVSRDTLLPPILYVVFDEHIGIEGWPAEFASTRAMRDQLRQFYLGEGFRLFGRAYSKYVNTEASIPAFLNWPVADPHTVRDEPIPDQRYVIKSNDVFRKLSAAGYRIRVYQTTYMDFCDPRAYAIRSCETRPGNSVRNLSLHHLPLWQQMRIVGLYYLEYDSHFYRLLRGLYQHVAGLHPAWPQWTARIRHSEAPAALELLDRLQADLRTDDPRGTLYFAHVLIPHNPYEFDAACRSLSHPNLWVEISRTNTPAERALKYDLYAGQVGCLSRHLAGLLQTVDSMPLGRQMVVIFQGDHGRGSSASTRNQAR